MADRKAATKATKQSAKRPTGKADGESEVLAKIAEMGEPDRALAERVHAIVKALNEGAMWPVA